MADNPNLFQPVFVNHLAINGFISERVMGHLHASESLKRQDEDAHPPSTHQVKPGVEVVGVRVNILLFLRVRFVHARARLP